MPIKPKPLTTENLLLTSPYLTDLYSLFDCLSDSRIFKYNTWNRHEVMNETFAFLNNVMIRAENGDGEWVIRRKDDEENLAIGMICLREIFGKKGVCELGFWLGYDYHKKGYGSEAVKKVVRFGFDVCKIKKIEACCHPENIASIKILEKNGFKFEKEVENTFDGKDFVKTDKLLLFSLID